MFLVASSLAISLTPKPICLIFVPVRLVGVLPSLHAVLQPIQRWFQFEHGAYRSSSLFFELTHLQAIGFSGMILWWVSTPNFSFPDIL